MSNASHPLSGFLVTDMDWLTPDLAVGGDLSHDIYEAMGQSQWLERQGVTDIIDCRGEWSDETLVLDQTANIRYHHLPTDDHGGQLDPEWWDRGIAIARSVVERGGTVFVHCHMGVNRGPSMALAILFDRGVDPVTAFDLLRARRPQAYAIYATQYLRLQGRRREADELDAIMARKCDHDALVATIGQIRKAESGGRYRFPLQPCGNGAPARGSARGDLRLRSERRFAPRRTRRSHAPAQGRRVDRVADRLGPVPDATSR